jgi:hypothetical protein
MTAKVRAEYGRELVGSTGAGVPSPWADNVDAGVITDLATRSAIDAVLARANSMLTGRYFDSEAAVAIAFHNALAAASDQYDVEFYADIYRIAGTRGRSLHVPGVVMTSYHRGTVESPVSPSTYRGLRAQSNPAEWHVHPGWSSDFSDPRSRRGRGGDLARYLLRGTNGYVSLAARNKILKFNFGAFNANNETSLAPTVADKYKCTLFGSATNYPSC